MCLGQRSTALEEVRRDLNQQWRRNIKKAEKAGVKVVQGGDEDVVAFHQLYVETAERDRFLPRPLAYFQRMWTVLRAEDPDRMRLYLAHHEGEMLAAATMLTVGEHACTPTAPPPAGTGGQAVEYLGEWDYPLNKVLHKALDLYMSRR